MNKYKTYEELKEELGENYDKFMYEMNLELVKQKDKAIEYIEDNTHYFSTDTKEIYFSIDTETDEEFCNTLENILKGNDNNE